MTFVIFRAHHCLPQPHVQPFPSVLRTAKKTRQNFNFFPFIPCAFAHSFECRRAAVLAVRPSLAPSERARSGRGCSLSLCFCTVALGQKRRERRGRKKEKEDTKRPENFLPAELKGPSSSSVGPPQTQSHLDRCWVKLATGCKKTFIHPSSNLSKVVGEVQQCAVCRRPFCSRVGGHRFKSG